MKYQVNDKVWILNNGKVIEVTIIGYKDETNFQNANNKLYVFKDLPNVIIKEELCFATQAELITYITT